jgi:hypothetical protein
MATNIRIIRASDFIKATPEGQLDFEKSKKILIEIESVSTSLLRHQIILDVRKAQSTMSIADLWYLAAEVDKLRSAFSRKTAVLCPLEGFDDAGFFALCAKNRGVQISAFTSFEDAVEWLIGNET